MLSKVVEILLPELFYLLLFKYFCKKSSDNVMCDLHNFFYAR